MNRFVFAALILFCSAGCATQFFGNAKVPNGAAGCRSICGGYGMELIGMVAMGEYSDGCICQVAGKQSSMGPAAAAAPAVAGVAMQMSDAEKQRARERAARTGTPKY